MEKRSDGERDNSINSINSINEKSVNNEQAVNIPSLLSKQSVVHVAVNTTDKTVSMCGVCCSMNGRVDARDPGSMRVAVMSRIDEQQW
jgi:hypothetical protein